MIVFTVLVCLLLSACGNETAPTADSTKIAEDCNAQNEYLRSSALSFQETDAFYCGSDLTGSFLHYYDKKAGISGLLCADPACTHDSPACGAYAQAGANLTVWGKERYWVAQDPDEKGADLYLWHSDLVGSNRERVKKISFDDIILPYQPQRFTVHRGRLYMLGRSSIVNGTKTAYRVSLLSMPLDSSEDFKVLEDLTVEQGVEATVRYVGDSAYLSLVTFPEGGPYDLQINRYDTKSGEKESLFRQEKLDAVPGALWVTPDEMLYLPGTTENGAFVWKIENGEPKQICAWEQKGSLCVLDGIIVFIRNQDAVRYAEIMDQSGELLYSGKLFPEEAPDLPGDLNAYNWSILGGDRDKLILNLSTLTDSGMDNYTVLQDLHESLKMTVLWSNIE